ncbi:uncharacterized protein LOC105439367 [Strongylocentrotus purpuratus]|uniref:Uncharacterized protein n=1 Tax=Strongylocentrotus purpuratus TaxID=7668 RepID=A0A7M7NUJ1_STRPU|nr:uncharacterized protein LOC105439367 [Strongylocentrotus purpuratus]
MDLKWKTLMIIFIIHGLLEIQAGSAPPREESCATPRCKPVPESPTITIECDPGSTIRITKGVCIVVPSCDDYDPSLESLCDNSDKTAQWAPYCETVNPCSLTVSCVAGSMCPGEYTYGYADYECVTDETTAPTTLTSGTPETPTEYRTPTPGVRGETTVPTRSTSGTPETPTEYRTPTPGKYSQNYVEVSW